MERNGADRTDAKGMERKGMEGTSRGRVLQLPGKLTQVPEIARNHGEIYENISLKSGIRWGLAAPRPPHGFPRVLGHGGSLKNIF